MQPEHKLDRCMPRCSTEPKITTLHPLQMKLQRKHRGEDAARNCSAAKKARGPDLMSNAMRQESGVEVIPLNKHKEDGSHNREV